MPDFEKVAQWMRARLDKDRTLYQQVAADEIAQRFGENFVYINPNGNRAIHKKVLAAFRVLSEKDVVWERRERYWRIREDFDPENLRTAL